MRVHLVGSYRRASELRRVACPPALHSPLALCIVCAVNIMHKQDIDRTNRIKQTEHSTNATSYFTAPHLSPRAHLTDHNVYIKKLNKSAITSFRCLIYSNLKVKLKWFIINTLYCEWTFFTSRRRFWPVFQANLFLSSVTSCAHRDIGVSRWRRRVCDHVHLSLTCWLRCDPAGGLQTIVVRMIQYVITGHSYLVTVQ